MDNTQFAKFLDWCNQPIYRPHGDLGFRKRVVAQFPEYNSYIIIDESGNSVFPRGKFLTAQEVYEHYEKTLNQNA